MKRLLDKEYEADFNRLDRVLTAIGGKNNEI
jgi:hypothetical protein